MKKLICLTTVLLVLVGCLTACNFSQSMAGALAGEAESTPNVEKMMTALAESNAADAKALMHPDVAERSDSAIVQMSAFLSGRKATDIKLQGINVNTSTGTSGKTRQEQVTYRVTLTDGETVYLSAIYLSNDAGTGFYSFQLVLGLV